MLNVEKRVVRLIVMERLVIIDAQLDTILRVLLGLITRTMVRVK